MVSILKRFGTVLQRRFGTPQLPRVEQLDESGVYMIADVERLYTRNANYAILSNDGTSGGFGSTSITLVNNLGGGRIPYDDILFIRPRWVSIRINNDFGFDVLAITRVNLKNNPQGPGTNGFDLDIFRHDETIPSTAVNNYFYFDIGRTVSFDKVGLNAFQDETSIEQLILSSTAIPTSGPATGDVRKEVIFNIEYALKSDNPNVREN